MDSRRSETWFFIALLAVTVFLAWMILAPYVSTLVLAGTLAFLFQPVYRKFVRVLRYESVAALCVVVIVTLIIFLPLGYFGVRIFGDATALYESLSSHGGFDFGATLTDFLRTHFNGTFTPAITLNFNDYVRQGLTWLIQNLGSFFSGVAQIFFTAFLTLFGLFYFLKDGDRLKKWIYDTVPLSSKYTEKIVREVEVVGSSVIKGTLMVAVVQGIVMGIGFFLFRVPDPTFWGALVVPVSIVPIVGVWLVTIPVVVYLLLAGQTVLGIGLLAWSVVLINLVYNILSPQLIHRGADIHPYLILLSVLGGIGLFGPIGFLVGPLVMALLFSLLKMYAELVVKRG